MSVFFDALLIIGGSLVLALGGMWLVRKYVPAEVLRENHEVAGYMLSIVGTLYAILLGLIVVNVQTKFEVASQMAVTEANCLSDVAHLSAVYPDAQHDEIRGHLYEYCVAAGKQDWSRVATGEEPEATIPPYRALWISINHLQPSDSRQQSSYSNLLSAMTQLGDARRYRMVASRNGLPAILWSVLIIGEILIVLLTYFFAVSRLKAQALLMTFVVVFLSLNLFLVHLYENPYRYELGARNAGVTFRPDWFEPNRTDSKSSNAVEVRASQ